METLSINGLSVFFEAADRDAAELIGRTCKKSSHLIYECWGVGAPTDLRVYVMTSWLGFVFQSTPWRWRILMGITLPLWGLRAKAMWNYAGGWARRYGQRHAVGVKPPRLIQLGDRGIGDRIFVREKDVNEKVQHVTCHELTHAFTTDLALPTWLHEGIAMVTVDEFFGRPTVKPETLADLTHASEGGDPGGTQNLDLGDQDAVVALYIRGYWITRFLRETHPELLKRQLAQRHSHKALQTALADALGIRPDVFWSQIDGLVVSHYAAE